MEFDWLLTVPVAHRGLHDDEYPENSMPSFRAAIEHGFNIEIDVHLTRDGALVVFHDDTLKRVCGVDGKIKDFTLEELKKLRLCDTEYTIPTFDEFLQLVAGRTGILCEIKGLNPYDNSIAGQLVTWRGLKGKERAHMMDFMGKLWINRISKPHFIAYDIRSAADNKYLEKARELLPVLVWTVNTPERLDTAMQVADNIIFEDIAPLVEEKFAGRLRKDAPLSPVI